MYTVHEILDLLLFISIYFCVMHVCIYIHILNLSVAIQANITG